MDSDGCRIHDFVVGVHSEHGLRLEVRTTLFTLMVHDIFVGGIYLVIYSLSLLICVVCFCALYGTPDMTVGLALTMIAQTLMAIFDDVLVKNHGNEFWIVPLFAMSYVLLTVSFGRDAQNLHPRPPADLPPAGGPLPAVISATPFQSTVPL